MCVGVRARMWAGEGAIVCACVGVQESERMCVCVSVKWSVSVNVCVCEGESVWVRVCGHVRLSERE